MENELFFPWVFWYSCLPKNTSKQEVTRKYQLELVPLGTVTTIQEFASAYSYLRKPTEMKPNWNLAFFKDQIKPMWEYFPDGGCFLQRLKRCSETNQVWEDLLVECARGGLGEDVQGVMVSAKSKEVLLQVWVSQHNFAIFKQIEKALGTEGNWMFKYHSESMRDMSTTKNARPVNS